MNHITPLNPLDQFLHSFDYDNYKDRQKILDALKGMNWTIDLEFLSIDNLKTVLSTTMPNDTAGRYATRLKEHLYPGIVDLETAVSLDKQHIEVNHILEDTPVRSGEVAEFTLLDECSILSILSGVMDMYLCEYGHKVLLIDTLNCSGKLQVKYDVDTIEVLDMDALDHALQTIESGEYGLVIIHSLSSLYDTILPMADFREFGLFAIRLNRIMQKLKRLTMRMNLITIYTNDMRLATAVKDDQIRFVLQTSGGNTIRYAPHVRLLFEQGQVRVTDSSYHPHTPKNIILPDALDEFF